MRSSAKHILTFFLFLMCTAGTLIASESNEPSLEEFFVKTKVDRSIITIGEKINYEVEVIYPKDMEIFFPQDVNQLGGFAVKDFRYEGPDSVSRELYQQRYWFSLDTYVVGAYVIPPLKVVLKDKNDQQYERETSEIYIEVKSTLGDGEVSEDIRPAKSMVKVTEKKNYLIWLLLVFVLLVFSLIFITWLRNRKSTPHAPRLSPFAEASRRLQEIKKMPLDNEKDIKEYYFVLNNCLRRYLDRQYSLKALEETAEELIEEILNTDLLRQEQKDLLRKIAEQCDFVKFAKYIPSKEEIQEMTGRIESFIEKTKDFQMEEKEAVS